jgi:hypothetical protein
MMNTLCGSARDRRRVTAPVPQASSSTLVSGSDTSRCARSMAYGSKISGTRYLS